jgi:hypothetical protein
MPAGSISECTCQTCTPLAPVPLLTFRTGRNVSTYCGGPGFTDSDGQPPTSGKLVTDTSQEFNLGAGCLYMGGGNAGVPGALMPDGAIAQFDVPEDCGADHELILAPHAGTSTSCTEPAGPGKACINDLSNWPILSACTTDADCPHTAQAGSVAIGSCVDKPNCLFGAPLPIENGGLSTCVINTIGTAPGGSIIPNTGAARLNLPLRSHTFIRPNIETTPCPVCVSGTCSYGPRQGMPCTGVGTTGVTIECPPPPDGGAYLPEFNVSLSPLSTGMSQETAADGIFCPNQHTLSAFGLEESAFQPTPLKVVEIDEQGAVAGNICDNLQHDAILASVFCIPASGSVLIDGAADFPGPGAFSIPGTLQMQGYSSDENLNVVQVRMRRNSSTSNANGLVTAKGDFLIAPPSDAVTAALGISLRVDDALTTSAQETWSSDECAMSTSGAVSCRSANGASRLKLLPQKSTPNDYRFSARLRRLGIQTPFAGPVTVTVTYGACINRIGSIGGIGSIGFCGSTNSGLRCPP